MKPFFIALICILSLISCQDAPKKQVAKSPLEIKNPDSIQHYQGEFIYVDSAAVLKGSDFIYGIKIDSMAKSLASSIDSLKRNPFDMVPVQLKGILHDNTKAEGWDKILTIKEIIKISPPRQDKGLSVENGKK